MEKDMDSFQMCIKAINKRLGDKESKSIFQNRLMYSITDDYSYMANILFSLECCKWLISEIERCSKYFDTNQIWIFGAGAWGSRIYDIISKCVKVKGFIDNDEGKYTILGKKIYRLEDILSGGGNGIYVIATKFYQDIEKQLQDNNIHNERIISFGRRWSETVRKQYFDKEIVCEGSDEEEVFIDCGCYNGGTVDAFVEWSYGKYNKIIAFEPDERMYFECKNYVEKRYNNAVVINGAVGAHNGEVRFNNTSSVELGSSRVDYISGNCVTKMYSIDEVLDGEKATFIKMDIEGSELEALRGVEKTIKKYKPILAICVYHKREDIWEIADYILSLHKDYTLYFRHYSLIHTETVLYAK